MSALVAGKAQRVHTLVVLLHVSQMIATGVVGFAHAHGIVREVDIAVVAC